MATVYLGLGSNIAPEANLELAMRELRRRFGEVEASPVYRSAAVGFEGDDFLNLVVRFETDDSPDAVCREIGLIHNLSGRDRGGEKWVSRPLDIDLLLYNDLVMDERPVRVPRSDILEYAFVLRPLADLAPGLKHPVTGQTMMDHWQSFDSTRQTLTRIDLSF